MKFRIIMSVVLLAVLFASVLVTGESAPQQSEVQPAPTPSTDDKAFKFSVN